MQMMSAFKKALIALTLAVALIFAGCFFSKTSEPFSEEKANETAIAYLKKKYGEEFAVVGNKYKGDSIAFGKTWYIAEVIKSSQKGSEDPREYEVSVSKDKQYTVLGDTVMMEYYEKMYHDFAEPFAATELGDTPFVLVMISSLPNEDYDPSHYGFFADAEIPNSFGDEKSVLKKSDIQISIYVPRSCDKGQLKTVCRNIQEHMTKDELYDCKIIVLSDEVFEELASSEDKYWHCKSKNLINGGWKKYTYR